MGRQRGGAADASELARAWAPADRERVRRWEQHVGVRPLRVHPAASLPEQWGEWIRLLEHGTATRRAQHLGLDPKQHDHRRRYPADGNLQPGILRHETPGTFRGSRLSTP